MRCDRVAIETGQPHRDGDRFAHDPGYEVGVPLPGAGGGDEEHPFVGDTTGDVVEEEQRRRIGPVHVVEDEQQRSRAADLPERPRNGLELPEALLPAHRGRPRTVEYVGSDAGKVRARSVGPGRTDEIGTLRQGPQDLPPRPERGCTRRFGCRTPGRKDTTGAGAAGELLREPRLADSGLTLAEQDLWRSLERATERILERPKLDGTTHYGSTPHRWRGYANGDLRPDPACQPPRCMVHSSRTEGRTTGPRGRPHRRSSATGQGQSKDAQLG